MPDKADVTGHAIDRHMAKAYEEWAAWLVAIGAPWNMRFAVAPPKAVLRVMPKLMFDEDNRNADGTIIHSDVTVEDYADGLNLEWGVRV